MGLFRRSKEREAERDRESHTPVEPPPTYGASGSAFPQLEYDDFAPPPGPPPGFQDGFQPPSYPPLDRSHKMPLFSAATDDERDMGDDFCNYHPLFAPNSLTPAQTQKLSTGRISLAAPPLLSVPTNSKLMTAKRFRGELQEGKGDGTAYIRSKKDTKDCLFVSDVPLYAPLSVRNPKIYFEVTITSLPHPEEAAIAIGFVCLPYPPFRLPGWHRGSLAVHSDDGRRYVNDSLSGKDFTTPFSTGEVVGIGIDYLRNVVFFTRNGKFDSEWSLVKDRHSNGSDPYRNYQDGGVIGLNGSNDVYAAVGVYGSVGAVVNFGGVQPFKYQL
ncbi:hypothetical protein TRVA0_058S00496 [Trichomonascus vanleenenianus]|uniref:SSH4 family protein n=1 Tax=Trichomonascus vanleenenianus TaxID=2268995 RepID=UPI003ECA2874